MVSAEDCGDPDDSVDCAAVHQSSTALLSACWTTPTDSSSTAVLSFTEFLPCSFLPPETARLGRSFRIWRDWALGRARWCWNAGLERDGVRARGVAVLSRRHATRPASGPPRHRRPPARRLRLRCAFAPLRPLAGNNSKDIEFGKTSLLFT